MAEPSDPSATPSVLSVGATRRNLLRAHRRLSKARAKDRLVVFIGNGFTISLASHLGIQDTHDTMRLVPPPDWVQQLHQSEPPLWSAARFPQLWSAYHELAERRGAPTFHTLCRKLSRTRAFTIGPHGSIIYNSLDAGLQLRWYLWTLFSEYDRRLRSRLSRYFGDCPETLRGFLCRARRALEGWPPAAMIRSLADSCHLTLVSFNYDCYLELLLRAFDIDAAVPVYNCVEGIWRGPKVNCRVLKPHGSLSFAWPRLEAAGFGFGMQSAQTPVLFAFDDHVVDLIDAWVVYPPLGVTPRYPDLVPPGHTRVHLMNPLTDVRQAVLVAVGQADAVGAFGFSASPPDAAEFRYYLGPLRGVCPTFCVATRRSRSRGLVADQMLSALSCSHRFFDVSEVDSVHSWLHSQLSAHSDS